MSIESFQPFKAVINCRLSFKKIYFEDLWIKNTHAVKLGFAKILL